MRPQPIRLKELREARGLTQEELADLMGVVPRQYQRYERGEGEPKLAGWIFLADFYDVSLDYLVDGRRNRRGAELREPFPVNF